ncbi:uncharacterized protein V1510DRAFT_418921 [Dipodascopsis tothii]|uniref:uncharacterized protein n=1 Tax=Dipodascopsis tothii TaxID=44089 RepID=UPI0034CD8C90
MADRVTSSPMAGPSSRAPRSEDEPEEYSGALDDSKYDDESDESDVDHADEEVFYVPLDLSLAPQVIEGDGRIQHVDLHTARPLVSVGSMVYEGQWEDMVGTNMYFDREGNLIGSSRTQIGLKPGRLVKKDELEKQRDGDALKRREPTLMEKIAELEKAKGR